MVYLLYMFFFCIINHNLPHIMPIRADICSKTLGDWLQEVLLPRKLKKLPVVSFYHMLGSSWALNPCVSISSTSRSKHEQTLDKCNLERLSNSLFMTRESLNGSRCLRSVKDLLCALFVQETIFLVFDDNSTGFLRFPIFFDICLTIRQARAIFDVRIHFSIEEDQS